MLVHVLLWMLAAPGHILFDDFRRDARNYAILVAEALCHNAAHSDDTIVSYARVFQYFAVLPNPDVPADFDTLADVGQLPINVEYGMRI